MLMFLLASSSRRLGRPNLRHGGILCYDRRHPQSNALAIRYRGVRQLIIARTQYGGLLVILRLRLAGGHDNQ